MDWTEEDENALLNYLRDERNNKRFWKKNAEREKAFKDCAVFLSRQSKPRRNFEADDVKNFCLYLVKERYKLNQSCLSHLFHIGIFPHGEDNSCDIFTREECRQLSEEDRAHEEGRPIPEKPANLPLRTFESTTRQGARYKSRSQETSDSKNSSNNVRKRRKSRHPTLIDGDRSFSVPEGQKWTASFPGGPIHLVYKHRHMDGAEIRRKFAQLENGIMMAADSLSPRNKSKISLDRMHQYGPGDFRLLESIPIATMLQYWDFDAHFQIARALVGAAVFQWVFGDGVPDSETFGHPSQEAVDAVWAIKCRYCPQQLDFETNCLKGEQYDTRMLNHSYAILKDAYFWQTTQQKFLDVFLPKRSQELSGRLSTILGTLFEIEVPQCSLEHDGEQAWRKDCISWPCQVEAIFLDALDLCVKLRQRDHKTVFRWPAMNDEFDESFMQHEGESIPNQQSDRTVNITYMPAVIDQRDSEDPKAIERGVWYKAVVRLASAAEMSQVPTSTSVHNEEGAILID